MVRHVVVGGGVAGTCCALELCQLDPGGKVTLVSPDSTLKGMHSVARISQRTEEFEVREQHGDAVKRVNLTVVQGAAERLDPDRRQLHLSDGSSLPYDRLCLCCGATPKTVSQSPHVVTLRDADTVAELRARLDKARRVVLIGNGGIALELAHALRGSHLVWVMRQGHIGDAFFDLDAAAFLLTQLEHQSRVAAPPSLAQASPLPQPEASWAEPAQPGTPRRNSEEGTAPLAPLGRSSAHSLPARSQPKPIHEAKQHGSRGALDSLHSSSLGASSAAAALADATGHSLSHASSGSLAGPRDSYSPRTSQDGPSRDRRPRSGQRSSQERLSHEADQGLTPQPQGGSLTEADDHPATSVSVIHGRRNGQYGHAVGPRWTESVAAGSGPGSLVLEQNCQLHAIDDDRPGSDWPVRVRLTNGHTYQADLVVSAIGVEPNLAWLPPQLRRAPKGGGILVDRHMETSIPGVYAAGDVCCAAWEDMSPHWFQMRLWTQARIMGLHAAYCMAGSAAAGEQLFNLELFTHVTRFLGHRIVLLGQYNGQRLQAEPDADIVTYSRSTEGPSPSFVRVLLLRNKLMGAVLIGETGLEEAFENLIMDGLDLSGIGPELLDPDMDIDAVFD